MLSSEHSCFTRQKNNPMEPSSGADPLDRLSRRQIAMLRELHAAGSTSQLHEQLKQLLGLKKMGERARAIGALLQLQDCSGDSDEDTELVLEGNGLDTAANQGDDDEEFIIIEPNADPEPPSAPAARPAPAPARNKPAAPAPSSPSSGPQIASFSQASPTLLADDDLSEDQCVSLLRDLVEAYEQPAFVAKLQAFQREHGPMYVARLGPLVLEVQKPIFRRHGLPADASSVEKMKMAVHRRIAEGTPQAQRRLELMANQARRCLGIAPIPDTRSRGCAEDVFADMLQGKVSGVSTISEAEGSAEAVEKAVRAALDGGVLRAATSEFLLGELASGACEPKVVRSLLNMAECGLPGSALTGADAAPSAPPSAPPSTPPSAPPAAPPSTPPSHPPAVAILTELPSAEAFSADFVLPSRPCVLRLPELAAERWPPLRNLPDFAFLRRRCGHRRVPVKSLALDDSKGRPVFISDPELRLPLVAFLDAVEESERNGTRCPFYLGKVPLRAELPELHAELEAHLPEAVARLSSCFGPLIPQGIFTYFGCDRNVTSTHFDKSENLLLCVCGTKRLWLYPPSDAKYLYPVAGKDGSRSAAPPFTSFEELPSRLRETFAKVAHASPREVNLQAGDILYLPACWWHCVEGSRERNMIVNWWMGECECSTGPLRKRPLALSHFSARRHTLAKFRSHHDPLPASVRNATPTH